MGSVIGTGQPSDPTDQRLEHSAQTAGRISNPTGGRLRSQRSSVESGKHGQKPPARTGTMLNASPPAPSAETMAVRFLEQGEWSAKATRSRHANLNFGTKTRRMLSSAPMFKLACCPGQSGAPPAVGFQKVGIDVGFGNRGFGPSSFSRNVFTLPPRFASGRVAAALRGRRGGSAVAVPRGSPPRRSADPHAREARREGEELGARHHPPAALREREGRRRASRSAGRVCGCGTAGQPSPANADPPAREARREGEEFGAAEEQNPRNLSGRQPTSSSMKMTL